MLSFLRTRVSQSPPLHPPLRDVRWDGRSLTIALDGASESFDVALDLDGSFFWSETPDASAQVRFEFPFAPQSDAVEALARRGRDDAPLMASALLLRFGKPGIEWKHSDESSAQPMLAASTASRNVPYGIDCAEPEVAIVVPVYDAVTAVERCLDSVLEHTTGRARLIVIDDASPDAAIAPLLEHYATHPNVVLLRNESNRGFTATANRGIAQGGRADIVLLNADTRVGPNWLAGLRRAAYCAPDVATATAVSNNAGAFSVPELERDNALPAGWNFDESARALWQNAGTGYPELPTGNGFCMYIRRSVLDAVGALDEAAFPEGYGEENDFCQRASARGLRHVIAGNVLVHHARSQSFGHERRMALGAKGMAVLRDRWPHYEADVAAALHSYARRVLDWRVRRVFALAETQNPPRPRVLYVGAGIIASPLHDAWRVIVDGTFATLRREDEVIERAELCGAQTESQMESIGHAAWRWLQVHAIEAVVASHDAPAEILAAARALGAPLATIDARDDAARAVARAMASARSFAERAQ